MTPPAPPLASTELPTYTRWPITLVRGQGSTVWDEDGKSYLDLYGGHAVASTGHCHPKVVRGDRGAGRRKLLFYSNVVALPVRTRAAEAIARARAGAPGQVFFVNSGTEANENAMRLARRATGPRRRRVLRRRLPRPHGGRDLGGGPRQVPGARPAERPRATGIVPFGDLAAARGGDRRPASRRS